MNEPNEPTVYRSWSGYLVEFSAWYPPVTISRDIVRFAGAIMPKPKNWLVYP